MASAVKIAQAHAMLDGEVARVVQFYNAKGYIANSMQVPLLRRKWRTLRKVTYVPQGNSLLDGTVRDNLLLGNPDASEEQMREALLLPPARRPATPSGSHRLATPPLPSP